MQAVQTGRENQNGSFFKETDWVFLIFLFLFTNQMVFSAKILGLVFIYLARPNFNFGLYKGRIPKFYIYIVLLAVVTLLIKTREFTVPYLAAFAVGNFFWIAGFLAFHQLRLSLEKYGVHGVYNVMKVFVVLNLIFCLAQIANIIAITDTLNPYSGLDFPYGMSTGDNIYGFFMQNSYYNMMVSAMLSVYFIFKRNLLFAILSSLSLILVFGNYGTMVYLGVLGGLFITGIINNIFNARPGKSFVATLLGNMSPPGNFIIYIPVLVILVSVLYGFLSPENTKYIVEKLKNKVYAINTSKKNNYKTMLGDQKMDDRVFIMPADDYYALREKEKSGEQIVTYSDAIAVSKGKDDAVRKQARQAMTKTYIEKLQGKTLSLLETWQYLKSSPANFLFGAGTTRFSSLTAQKMAGYDSSRLYMNILPRYAAPEYKENHLLLIQERIKSDSKYYSNANWPDSFFNQLFGEYGILGALLFLIFYIGYFAKNIRHWSYTPWILIMLIPFSNLTYLFEALCVVVFFELLVIADIEDKKKKLAEHAG